MRNALIAILSAIIIAGAVLISAAQASTQTLRPCPTEDSTNCIWDAHTHGNGAGRSFVDIDGQTFYLEPGH